MSKRDYKGTKSEEIQMELESISENLSNIRYEVTHDVPNGYWKEQEEKILSQIVVRKESMLMKIISYKSLWYISSIAAGLLVLIWVLPEQVVLEESDLSLDSIELSALEEYLLDEAGSLDTRLSLEDTFYDKELWDDEVSQNDSNEK